MANSTPIFSAGEIYNKCLQGDLLTDVEVCFGVCYFKDLADKLIKCGPVFSFAFTEANRVYVRLKELQDTSMKKSLQD